MSRMNHLADHFSSMQNVVVIGSNSFSGSDFIDLLLDKKKFKVIGVSRSPQKTGLFLPYKRHKSRQFQFRQIDLNQEIEKLFKLFNRFKPEFVVNFAAQSEVAPSWRYPDHWFQTNAVAVAKLGNFLKDATYLKRYVHISSPEVYGTCKGKVTENARLNPTTPYAASKAAGDLFLFTLVKNFKFPLIMIRATNVYGAHQQLFKIIPRTVISIKLDRKLSLHGGGHAIKSYIHIRDVSNGELAAMLYGKPGEIYHLSPDQSIAIKKLVSLICEQLNVNMSEVIHSSPERLGQDAAYIIDSSKARKKLHWQPKFSLEQGITEVIDWINANWNQIRRLPHEYIHKT